MRAFFQDLKECLKISLKVYGISFIIGILIGLILSLIKKSFTVHCIMEWGSRLGVYAGCLGLFIAAISFTKKEHMRPLNYQKQWRTYFDKFNLAHVIFFISAFCLVYSIIIESILFFV